MLRIPRIQLKSSLSSIRATAIFSFDRIILLGVYGLFIISLALFFVDAYFFYAYVTEKTPQPPPAPTPPPVSISEEDITAVIDSLNKREGEFKRILHQ